MNVSNIKGIENQENLSAASKNIDQESKDNKLQPTSQICLDKAAIVSRGEKPKEEGTYRELLDTAEEKEKEPLEKEEESSFEDISNTMSEEDYECLKEEGMSLEKFDAGRLERALIRIKENREVFKDTIETHVENKKEMEETIKKIAIGNKFLDPMAKKLAQKLADANMPITEENIENLLQAMNMVGVASNLSEGAKTYLVENKLEPTIENIYQSQYSTQIFAGKESSWIERDIRGFETIKAQVEPVIKDAGMEVSEESREQAKWLYKNNLPITKENLLAVSRITMVEKNAGEEKVVDKMIEAMQKGLKPEKANLDGTKEEQVKKTMDEIGLLSKQLEEDSDIASITAKRQLEEIRLKLTTEAGIKLLSKGIKLDTNHLQEIVDGLKEMEQEYYKQMFKEASMEPTNDQVNVLKMTTKVVEDLKEAPNYVLGFTLQHREIQTIGSLYEAADSMKVRLDKAGETYEALMTQPRRDMGDSIQKAFQNVPDILNHFGLENSTANQRAVRILSYNQMEVNEDSIQAVKSYDLKVNNLLKELKPAVTIELIQRKINPLTLTLDNLTSEVSSIRKEIGASEEEQYANYLWKLEKNHAISENDRKSYIGIYRLLNQVKKTDGAAIGMVINQKMELTLKNLLSAVRTKTVSGMDVSIDDSFGMLSDLQFTKERISDQIETSFMEPEKTSYYQDVVTRILEEISPQKVNEGLKNGRNEFMDMSLERLQDMLEQEVEGDKSDIEFTQYQMQKLQEVAKTEKEAVAFLENYQLEPTIGNIVAVTSFYQKGKSFFKNFDKYADKEYNELLSSVTNAIEDADTLQEKYSDMEEKVNELIQSQYQAQIQEDSSKKVEELRLFAKGIELAKRLSKQECYQIPIIFNKQITTMNLTLQKGTMDSGKITMTINDETYGRIEGEFRVKESEVKGFVLCDSKAGQEVMRAAKESMNQKLETLGLSVKQLTIGYDKNMVNYIKKQEKNSKETSTRLLYQVAKGLVKSISETIQQEEE